MAEKKWYTLHVQSGFEFRVKANLEKALKEEGVEDKVEEIFIPAVEKVVFKALGKEKGEVPLHTEEPKSIEIEGDEGKTVTFRVENGQVWVESCQCEKKKCTPDKPISRIGQKIKCPENRVEAKIELRDRLYPGYIFIKADLDKDLQSLIRRVPRVLGFVSAGGKPVTVSEAEIQAMKERLKRGVPRIRKLKFDIGDKVKIKEGPFIGFEGTISEIDPEHGKLIVLVNIFDRQTPVELEFDQVEKIS
ncbi:transcription termination/antitermination protein NusG [Thermovibrio ammonificans]|jgi:transcriptional antiterminator NusG|uniref:Transcription termination/antitermination protein NusG n=1 Tax=Thermovibrio ammonificans (strain DSM 15698 / JCM 12110 / HB-1) TaxID=648996 RepID=E8T510_THEA1|nr:transcription termination/antitermination protein NusG [Thermovibrio ammonificans]ADU97542.1 NusG antitermination factor [Thermovibrio ammonificans HB-1]